MLVHQSDSVSQATQNKLSESDCHSDVQLVPVAWLKAHEEFIPSRFEDVLSETVMAGGYHWPIIVDSKTGVILDGHHRYQVSLYLGLTLVPAVLIDYLNDSRVSVRRWTPESEHWAVHSHTASCGVSGDISRMTVIHYFRRQSPQVLVNQ